jgi:hypothetical protein
MPGAVAIATTANTSATPPIPSRVGQNCRILDAAVTLFVLAFVTSCTPRPLLLPRSPPAPGHARSTEIRQPRPSARRLRLSEQSQQAPPTVARDRQLSECPPPNPAAHTTNTIDYAIGHHGPSPHFEKPPSPGLGKMDIRRFRVEVPGAGRSPDSVTDVNSTSGVASFDRALCAVHDFVARISWAAVRGRQIPHGRALPHL